MNLQSFCFPTRGRSEIARFGRLTTRLRVPGDLLWMSVPNLSISQAQFASQERWIVSIDPATTGSYTASRFASTAEKSGQPVSGLPYNTSASPLLGKRRTYSPYVVQFHAKCQTRVG